MKEDEDNIISSHAEHCDPKIKEELKKQKKIDEATVKQREQDEKKQQGIIHQQGSIRNIGR